MSGMEIAVIWLGMAILVTLLGLYAGYRMGLARNDWERHRFEKIEEENRSLRRELSVARVKIDGATRLFEVTETERLASAPVPAEAVAEPAPEPAPPETETGPAADTAVTEPQVEAAVDEVESPAPPSTAADAVLDFRKITKPVEDVVIDLTDGGSLHDAEEIAMLAELLDREIDLMVADADS